MTSAPTTLAFLPDDVKATAMARTGADNLILVPDWDDADRVADGTLPALVSPGFIVLAACDADGSTFTVGRIIDQRWNRPLSRRTKNPIWAYEPDTDRHQGWAYPYMFVTPPLDLAIDTWTVNDTETDQ